MIHSDLPPLPLLIPFEAAARLGSFKQAAAELNITPSAVSQQIRNLEAALSVRLFERRPRAIELTPAGAEFLSGIRAGLVEIGRATRYLQRTSSKVLRVSMMPFIAYDLAIPRMPDFRARCPGVELHVEASMALADLVSQQVDAAVRIGTGPWPGLQSHHLGDLLATPVCSPEMAREIRSMADLHARPLICIRSRREQTIDKWGHPTTGADAGPVLTFESYFETIRAAEEGYGYAEGLFPITTGRVLSGRLAVPLAVRVPISEALYLVHQPGDESRPGMSELHAWLAASVVELPQLPPGRRDGASAGKQ